MLKVVKMNVDAVHQEYKQATKKVKIVSHYIIIEVLGRISLRTLIQNKDSENPEAEPENQYGCN